MGTVWRWSSIIVVAAVAWLIVLALAVHPALAGGTVGTGSPSSCTEAALDTALGGGGAVTFNCGAAPHTITLSSYKSIGANTTILGGGKITLSGGGSTPHFQIFNGYALTLNGITLSHGSGLFGSIQNFGTLVVSDSVLADNVASVDGGAIDNSNGRVDMTGVRLIRNRSVGDGGALFNDGGVVTLSASQVATNTAQAGFGGGIYNINGGHLAISGSQIYSNTANRFSPATGGGGGIFSQGTLTLTQVTLARNVALRSGGGVFIAQGDLLLTQSTLTGNSATDDGGGIYNLSGVITVTGTTLTQNSADGEGGGLQNSSQGTARLSDVTFTGNTAGYYGGAVANRRALTLNNAVLSGNSAGEVGGGVYIESSDATVFNYVVLNGNSAAISGGGIYHDKSTMTTLNGVTLNGNSAGARGGGIFIYFGPIAAVNVTLSANTAVTQGGAIFNYSSGDTNLTNVTLSGNAAGSGGAIYNTAGYTVSLKNSIMANSVGGGNCGGSALTGNGSDKHSLSSDNTCLLNPANGSKNGVPVLLGPLADNGGPRVGAGSGVPMLTHRPQAGSPAVDGVLGTDFPLTDQRGVARPIGLGADIGSLEIGGPLDARRLFLPVVRR